MNGPHHSGFHRASRAPHTHIYTNTENTLGVLEWIFSAFLIRQKEGFTKERNGRIAEYVCW
jgi:hypothetical protein